MKKLIIFDLDGTLLNTIKDIRSSLNKTLLYYGYKEISVKMTKENVGYGSKELIRRVLPRNTTADIRLKVTNSYLKNYDEISGMYTKPYRGIMSLLESLKSAGYLLAIASNKSDHLVKELNEKLFKGLFNVALGTKKGVLNKPHPQIISNILNELKIKSSEAIYIGDTEVDIRTANNAKMDVVAVTWGFRNEDQLRELHPNYTIRKPKQLINVLNNKYHN